jgi:hypothetical protein
VAIERGGLLNMPVPVFDNEQEASEHAQQQIGTLLRLIEKNAWLR